MPRTSIHQLCLPSTTFEEDVRLAAEVGYDGLGIDTRKLDAGREAAQAELLRAAGLRAGVCCNRVWSILPTTNFPEPADPAERVADICAGIERLAPFAPDAVFVVLGASWPGGLDAAWRSVSDGLRRIHEAASRHGTTLAVEPMLREGGVRVAEPLVRSVDETIDVFERLGLDDASVVVDVWHLFDSPDLLAQLRRHARRVSAVQMCDYHEPRTWRDRLLPGDGEGDVPGILGALEAGGFDGWLDLEVFSDELWQAPPREFMARGLDAIHRSWAARHAPEALP
jgi:sugar phosphate isomerase/epimerase